MGWLLAPLDTWTLSNNQPGWGTTTSSSYSLQSSTANQMPFPLPFSISSSLQEWLGVSSGVLAGLVTVLPRAQAKVCCSFEAGSCRRQLPS